MSWQGKRFIQSYLGKDLSSVSKRLHTFLVGEILEKVLQNRNRNATKIEMLRTSKIP